MSVVILHLSDIHIKTPRDPILERTQNIAASTFSSLPNAECVFLVVSGDIAFSGSDEQYSLANDFFKEIAAVLRKETSAPIHYILAPGNHDCDFDKDNAARRALLKTNLESSHPDIDDSVIKVCVEIQQSFLEFRKNLEADVGAEDDLLWRTRKFDVGGKTIIFDSLNISWMSQLKEEPSRLYFPHERYARKADDSCDLRIVVQHHPLNWFSQSSYRPFRTFVRNLANIVVTGHEHQPNFGENVDVETGLSAYVEGGVLQGMENLADSSFNIVVVDFSEGQYCSTQYAWAGKQYEPVGPGSWAGYRNLPEKRSNTFQIQNEFRDSLDDPGAFLRHPGGHRILLSDIYVFPDLRKVEVRQGKSGFLSSSNLLDPEFTAKGVLVTGEENSGRSSLLYQLYLRYHDRGFVPLLIRGKRLSRTSERDIDAVIRRSVKEQYGEDALIKFEQTTKSQKLLLLDDFDEGPIKESKARVKLFTALKQRFDHMVVTVGEFFEFRELLDGVEAAGLRELDQYKMQPFGYVLRGKLIKRWVGLGADGTTNEARFIERCDLAERTINSVMARGTIPFSPLYLVTLLQSVEIGRSADFQDGALGHYYQFLMTEAFTTAGVPKEKLTEVFQYATQLAWYFHLSGQVELTEQQLKKFNSDFSAEWHTVEFSNRLQLLISAKVLSRRGRDFGFRYPYIYYYLKGKYLSENLGVAEIKTYIEHCCKHLYVRDYAHTILFLAHHANEEVVLDCIIKPLHGSFKNRAPVTFNGDTGAIAKLIEEAPKLGYEGGAPLEHRARRDELLDEMDDGHDGLAEKEEANEELSLLAQLTVLFKTVDILGQILKNQYSRIPRRRKTEVLDELFSGPLRALSDFFNFLQKYPDHLISEIEEVLKKRGNVDEAERKKIAVKVVAAITQMVSAGLLFRISQSVSSDDLLEDIQEVVKKNGTLAYKLIEVGVLLDSPRDMPRKQLTEVLEEAKTNSIASRITQLLVINRLYMFKTTIEDKQWLSSKVEIDMRNQQAIAFQGKDTRKLK